MTYMANGQLSAGAAGLPPASRQNIFPNKTLGTEFYFHFLGERWKVKGQPSFFFSFEVEVLFIGPLLLRPLGITLLFIATQ